MNADNEKSVCISKERLSAHFDGELKLEKHEQEHLKHCSKCSSVLKEFAYLAELLKKSMQIEVSPGLNDKIIRKAKYGEDFERSIPFNLSGFFLKAASIVIFAALAGILFYNNIKPEQSQATSADITALDQRKSVKFPAVNQQTVFLADLPQKNTTVNNLNLNTNGNIDYSNFARVSTGLDHKTVPLSTVSKRSIAINPLVEHLWVADNPENAVEFIKKSIKPNSKIKLEHNGNSFKIAFKINKAQAVKIVKKLHDAGYKLISPAQPQPEQKVFPGSSNDNIIYRATFTRN
jgi:hypothetical protein